MPNEDTDPDDGHSLLLLDCQAAKPPTDDSDTYATRYEDDASDHQPDSCDPVERMPIPDDYAILDKLGQGGMGIVFKARQKGLNRLVALKMIRPEATSSPEQVQRFRIEVEAVARLRHPNIIQIYDVGLAEGVPYCSLELLQGGSLAERIAGSPQPARSSAALLSTLSRAMHAAHEAGIIHRDLKPQNVLFDLDGVPKVTDFGLAKRLDVEDGLTLSFQVMGTPSYMAPEQALGKTREVGPLADVYALGAILYAMLTGRPPLQGTTWRETLLMVADQEPAPPSKLQPKIPRDLETIVLKCLAKERRKRYASALAMADDLGRFLDNKPILARRTPHWERGLKWSRRHPVAATLAALGLVASIGLAWAAENRNKALRQQASVEDERVAGLRRVTFEGLLKAQEQIGRGEVEEARLALTRLETTLQTERKLDDLRVGISATLHEARRRLDDRALREADRGRLARFGKLFDEAVFQDARAVGLGLVGRLDQARVAARAALELFGTFDPGGAWSLGPMPGSFAEGERKQIVSDCYLMLMVLAEATAQPLPGEDSRRQAVEALVLLDRASALRPPTRSYHIRRAACLVRAGDSETALLERQEADRLEPAGAFDRLLLGQQLYRNGDASGAIRQFAVALQEKPDLFWAQCLSAICSLNSSPSRPSEAWTALNACLQQKQDYAWLYLLRGFASGQMGVRDFAAARKAEAGLHFADAEADLSKAMGMGLDNDLHYALLMNRGTMRFQAGRTAGAVTDFEQAIALDPTRYNAYYLMAQSFAKLGRRVEAIGQLDRAIERKPDLALLYRERARLRGEETPDQINAALRDLDEAIRREPVRSRDAAVDHGDRGRLLLKLDRHLDALAACDAALAIVPNLASVHRDRAAALLERGEFEKVLDSCDAALTTGPPSAEMHELRGLARIGRTDFAGAIEDYNLALSLRPGRVSTFLARGRAYLFANSPDLALRDFEEAVRLAPDDPEGYSGRAAAKVRLRRHSAAALDAEESLRRREPTKERLYDAARTYAQAAAVASSEIVRRGRPALKESLAYEIRAAELLARALDRTPAEGRETFWREIVERDDAMAKLRKRSDLAQRARPAPSP